VGAPRVDELFMGLPGRHGISTGWLAGVAISAALAAGAMLWTAATAAASTLAWNVAWTAAAVSALAGMLAARSGAAGPMRARWTWWAAATACWVGGQIAWDLLPVTGWVASPNIADAGWWAFALLMIAGLLASPVTSRAVRLVAIAEALPLIAAAMALTFAELWDDAAASGLSAWGRASALAYPAVYVSAAVLTLQAMVGGSLRGARGPGLQLVLTGIVAQATAFILWSQLLLDQRYVVGESLIDPLWVVGLLAIAAGGALSAHSHQTDAAPAHEPGTRGGLLPAATFVVLIGELVRSEFQDTPLAAHLALAAGLLTCGGMLIWRGTLLERRLRRLLGRERAARQDLVVREAELAGLNERLAEDSRRDPLTGLLNRRALAEDLDGAAGGDPATAVALCDVDRFKAYNDRLGHLAGDEALRAVTATVRRELRATDTAYRFGGEELLLVVRAEAAEAVAVAERVRAAVAAMAIPHPDGLGGIVTVSIGIATGHGDITALLPRADAALYQAKSAGRNRVCAAHDTDREAAPAR
jgi:diguanylate cyclase (GGDEF)-like protein